MAPSLLPHGGVPLSYTPKKKKRDFSLFAAAKVRKIIKNEECSATKIAPWLKIIQEE